MQTGSLVAGVQEEEPAREIVPGRAVLLCRPAGPSGRWRLGTPAQGARRLQAGPAEPEGR